MGMAILCDICGIDVQFVDRISVSHGSIETGAFQADLCMDCSVSIRETEAFRTLMQQAKDALDAENARREQILADQQAQFDARAAVALEQQKEANAAMRAAGEV